MRKAIRVLCLFLISLCMVACGNDDFEAAEAVIKYEEAFHEHDGVALKEVALDLKRAGEMASDLGFKLGEQKQVEEANYGYVMKEYQKNEKERFFDVYWYSRDGTKMQNAYYVALTGGQWKVYAITHKQLSPKIEGLKPKIHRRDAQDEK